MSCCGHDPDPYRTRYLQTVCVCFSHRIRFETLFFAAWQAPYVNVFKLCDVDTLKDVALSGDVKEHMVGGIEATLQHEYTWWEGLRKH